MARLYPDLFNRLLETEALLAFRALVQLFTDRLATTTNELRATQKRLLYRIIRGLLVDGYRPADITIITFNQAIRIFRLRRSSSISVRRSVGVLSRPSCSASPRCIRSPRTRGRE